MRKLNLITLVATARGTGWFSKSSRRRWAWSPWWPPTGMTTGPSRTRTGTAFASLKSKPTDLVEALQFGPDGLYWARLLFPLLTRKRFFIQVRFSASDTHSKQFCWFLAWRWQALRHKSCWVFGLWWQTWNEIIIKDLLTAAPPMWVTPVPIWILKLSSNGTVWYLGRIILGKIRCCWLN